MNDIMVNGRRAEVAVLVRVLLLMSAVQIYYMPELRAQWASRQFRGIVKDSLSQDVLEGTIIHLLSMPGGKVLHTVRMKRQGFSFSLEDKLRYMLVASFVGYEPDTVLIGDRDSLPPLLMILLHPARKTMTEVVVRSVIPPATVKNDTISFNTQAYATRPHATIEELLRKLPGVEVDAQGNVTIQGKKVEKIYIDGKEFYLYDLRNATRNLPADIVSQVELFDNQSDQAKLSGIKDVGHTKAINIKLKKKNKLGYVGKAYGGLGSDGAYSAGGSFNSFEEKDWLALSGHFDNINSRFTGTENSSEGSIGTATARKGTLQYRRTENKFSATADINYMSSDNLQERTSVKQTFLADSSLTENRASTSGHNVDEYMMQMKLSYSPDSLKTFRYGNFIFGTQQHTVNRDTAGIDVAGSNGKYISSRATTNNTSNINSLQSSNSVSLEQKFKKKGRSLLAMLAYGFNNAEDNGSLHTSVHTFDSAAQPLSQSVIDQRYHQTTKTGNYQGQIYYSEPLSAKLSLDMQYMFNHQVTHTDKDSYDRDTMTKAYSVLSPLTTNHFENRTLTNLLYARLQLTQGKYIYQLGMGAQLNNLSNVNHSADSKFTQDFVTYSPMAVATCNFAEGKNLVVGYWGNSVAPEINQLQPVPDLTNPLLIRIGNPRLRQQFDHGSMIDYNYFDGRSGQSLQVSFMGTLSTHKITTATTLLSGGIQQMQYINLEGVYLSETKVTYGFPFITQKLGTASITGQMGFDRDKSYLNGEVSKTSGLTWGGQGKINVHPAEWLLIEASAGVNTSHRAYSLFSAGNSTVLNQRYEADLTYMGPLGWNLSTHYSIVESSTNGAVPPAQVRLWNAALYKTFLKSRAAQVRLSAFDLLNTSRNIETMASSNTVETTSSNLRGRFFLLSLVYDLKKTP
jgi:hypothetical protein